MEKEKNIQVLLYYKYVPIENAEEFKEQHLQFCKDNNLLGRIIVADEGINGTLAGSIEDTQAYMDHMHADERFKDLWFKIDREEENPFKKIFVRYKKEIINLGLEDDVDPRRLTGDYLEPEEFEEAILDEDTVVIDARNDYEYNIGHFRGAINPDVKNFRDLPKWVKENKDKFKDKKVVTYCTGGVRCEKFSGFLKKEGIESVGQLNGGITTYGKDPKVKGKYWDGMLYVFDGRISVPVNQIEHKVVGKDYFDGTPCERYINCANLSCGKKILASEENEHKYLGGCTHECRISDRNTYVKKHELSKEEVMERLEKIGETIH